MLYTVGTEQSTYAYVRHHSFFTPLLTVSFFLGGRTLQILKAKMSDGGRYSCVAINPAGEAQKLIYLTVYG